MQKNLQEYVVRVTAEFGHIDIDQIIEVISSKRSKKLASSEQEETRSLRWIKSGLFRLGFCWDFFTDENTSPAGVACRRQSLIYEC